MTDMLMAALNRTVLCLFYCCFLSNFVFVLESSDAVR